MIELKSVRTPTNGDKIRAASDEEMAEFILANDLDEEIHFCKSTPECNAILDSGRAITHEMCRKCVLDWLHQPAPISRPHENGMSARGHENIGENNT